MRIRWTPAAAADLQSINDYLKAHHPSYREPTLRKLVSAVYSLSKLPRCGRRGREEGTRELVFSPAPFVAVYRVREKSIEVIRVYHASQ